MNLDGKAQGTEEHESIPKADRKILGNGHAVGTDDGQEGPDEVIPVKRKTQKKTGDGHEKDVVCGQKTGFGSGGVLEPYLLKGSPGKKGNAAKEEGGPERDICRKGRLFFMKEMNDRDKGQRTQYEPDTVKRIGPHRIHTHHLGHEGKAPDECGEEEKKAIFHKNSFFRYRML